MDRLGHGIPHASALSVSHGSHALKVAPAHSSPSPPAPACSARPARSPPSCRNCKNTISTTIVAIDAAMSTSCGPMCAASRYCTTVNGIAATAIAGHTSTMAANPANAHTSQNGRRGVQKREPGSAPSSLTAPASEVPVTACIATTGIPSDPNATGAVFAIRADSPAACSGRNPSNQDGRTRHRRAESTHPAEKRPARTRSAAVAAAHRR